MQSPIKRAWRITYPLFLGYVSVGAVFGMMTVSTGLPGLYAIVSSVLLYAGASQFLLVGSVNSAVSLFEIFVSVFLLNLRHIFYYKPIAQKIETSGPKRWYSILTITDESFALIADDHVKKRDSFLVLALSHGFWILGTVIGVVLGGVVASAGVEGLDFSLTALFTVLFVGKLKMAKDYVPLLLCLLWSIFCWFVMPSAFFLIVAIVGGLVIASVLEAKPHG